MEHWERRGNLTNIFCPTQIIWGEHDRTYKWPQVEQLWKQIPEVSLAVIPACAHAVHMEKPELFNQVVIDFLERAR